MNPLDVLDDLRPDTPHLDTATADRVWERVVARHPDLADAASADSVERLARPLGAESTVEVSHRPTGGRSVALVGAVAAAVVGLVAIGSVVDRGTPDRSPAPATQPSIAIPPSVAVPPSEPEVDDPPATGTIGDDLAAATGFVLPSFVPEGLEITGLAAGRSVDMWDNPFGATRWAQVVDGSIERILNVRPPRPIDPRDPDIDGDDTVRGVPAEVWTQVPGQIGVSWNEAGHMMVAESAGLTEAELLGAVETLEIHVDTATVTLPDGGRSLGLVHESEYGFVGDDVVTSKVDLGDRDGPNSTVMYAVATPNTFGIDVDGFGTDEPGWEARDVDGTDMRILVRPVEQGGGTEIRWIDDVVRFQVYGNLDTDTVVEFARGLTLTDAATFKSAVTELAERETATMMTWAELDRVTFDDGMIVTVRSRTDGSGADAICVEAPVERCREQVSEVSIVEGYSDNVFDTFSVNGRNIVVGWQSSSEAERLGIPAIQPGEALNPADGLSAGTTATVDQLTHGTAGRFLEIEIPIGERPPRLNFQSGDDVLDAGAPAIRSAYEF